MKIELYIFSINYGNLFELSQKQNIQQLKESNSNNNSIFLADFYSSSRKVKILKYFLF